jgi:hypothetical protein
MIELDESDLARIQPRGNRVDIESWTITTILLREPEEIPVCCFDLFDRASPCSPFDAHLTEQRLCSRGVRTFGGVAVPPPSP